MRSLLNLSLPHISFQPQRGLTRKTVLKGGEQDVSLGFTRTNTSEGVNRR